MAEAACFDSALHGGIRMSVSIPSPSRQLPLRALESGDAIFIDAAELLFFPEAGVLFIDGNPHPPPLCSRSVPRTRGRLRHCEDSVARGKNLGNLCRIRRGLMPRAQY